MGFKHSIINCIVSKFTTQCCNRYGDDFAASNDYRKAVDILIGPYRLINVIFYTYARVEFNTTRPFVKIRKLVKYYISLFVPEKV